MSAPQPGTGPHWPSSSPYPQSGQPPPTTTPYTPYPPGGSYPPGGPSLPGGPGREQPPWGVPPPQPLNSLAVAAFVCALLLLSPVALVLGIMALSQSRLRAERGRPLAVAALALAGTQLVALAVLVPVLVMDSDEDDGRTASVESAAPADEEPEPKPSDEEEAQPGGEVIDVFAIELGDCFDTGGLAAYEEGTEEHSVTRVPCVGPHEAEAFGLVELEGYDSFPGPEELEREANQQCSALVPPYVLDTWTLPEQVQLYFYHPERTSWRFGDREILCFFGPSDGEELTSSLRGDESALSTEQARFLEITVALELISWREPTEEAGLAEYTEWAAEVAAQTAVESAALAAADWSTEVDGLVTELADARGESTTHWELAAEAEDESAFWIHYVDAYDALGIDEETAVRESLGLAT